MCDRQVSWGKMTLVFSKALGHGLHEYQAHNLKMTLVFIKALGHGLHEYQAHNLRLAGALISVYPLWPRALPFGNIRLESSVTLQLMW